MTQMGKTRKVVGTIVYLLDEGRFGIYYSLWLQYPMDFCTAPMRIDYVFQNSLDNHPIKRSILKWQIVCIAD